MKIGFLVKDYENPQSTAEIIEVACNDKPLRETIKRNAIKSVERFEKNRIDKLEAKYYTSKNIIKEMKQHYHQLQ